MPFTYTANHWDACTVLGIDRSRTRCYGWAPSKKRTCNNPIAVANHSKAQRLIVKLSRCSPSSGNITILLQQISRLLLCQRNHQNQSQSVVQRWKDKIGNYLDSVDEDEDEETESTASEEEVPDIGLMRQMTKLQGILRRVETALAANLDEQRRTQLGSSTTSSQSDFIQVSASDHATDALGPASSTHDREETADAQPSQLNLDHIQQLVRQLSMERESSQQRAYSESTVPIGDYHEEDHSSASDRTNSPQTVIGIEDRAQDRELPPAVDPRTTAASMPVIVGHDERIDGPDTAVPAMPAPAQRRESESPSEDTRTHVVSKNNAGGKQSVFQALLPDYVKRANCSTKSWWLMALTLYLGIVIMWCLLNPFPFGAGLLALDGPASQGHYLIAEGFRLAGPATISSSTAGR